MNTIPLMSMPYAEVSLDSRSPPKATARTRWCYSTLSRLASLNQDIVGQLSKDLDSILQHDPDADLSPLLSRYALKYATRRQRRINASSSRPKPKLNPTTTHDSDLYVAKAVEVLFPLQPTVASILADICVEEHDLLTADQVLLKRVRCAIQRGQQLQEHAHNQVTRISDGVVVKISPGRDTTEVYALRHIRERSSTIPAPELLGAISCGELTYIIMSYVAGESLQDIWPRLLDYQKKALKHQMQDVLEEIRSLDLPSQYYGCGSPPVCRDIRTENRQSEPYIQNEEDFNSFVLANPRERISQAYLNFIRDKVLPTNHDLVMTHGDFTRRNIIVAKSADGSLTIAGIIDWESAGAYPEYWEYVKMLHTVSAIEDDDWLQYLPHQESKDYNSEWAKQLLIDRISK